MHTVVAVDFGASSIRVCRVNLDARPLTVDVVHRHRHGPVADAGGHLRWDWSRLVAEMEKGLAAALERGPVASIGVDTWGVDYGLLDAAGGLVTAPFSYRDARTDGFGMVIERIGEERLYAITGVQLQAFNTIFQVAAHDRAELGRARYLLLLPELLVHHLTGASVGERTSAGTTGLVDIRSGTWSEELADAVGLDTHLLPDIRGAGEPIGRWQGVPVLLVGGHDTASAVAAMGSSAGPDTAFVSTGTWMLVGRERPEPDLSEDARRANFTNEIGALGGVRFLKNLAGSWLIEGCLPSWGNPPIGDLIAEADLRERSSRSVPGPVIDVANPRFLHPDDMLAEITSALGVPIDTPPPAVVLGIVESQAVGATEVIGRLGSVHDVAVFGGAQSELFRRALQRRSGLSVVAGPVEATALGNALVQGVALGVYAGLADARAHLADRTGA